MADDQIREQSETIAISLHTGYLPFALDASDMIGTKVSHYEIQEELGRGGMGVVYRARDARLERDVALKFLPQHLTSDTAAKERFIREAKTASSLDHQHICTIHDIGESAEGQTYIVMAYYSGSTLKAKIEKGPMDLSEAVSLAVQVADGLAAAHRKGIVHRDVKPGNIIVTDEGVAKILDFGLAKLAGGAVELTAENSTLGTAAYMSPEQARGDELDARSDVWSLGVVLYEMLAGRRPFAAEYEQALVYGILNEDPPPIQSIRPEVPDDVASVIEGALTKDVDERYSAAADLAADLRGGSVPLSSAVGLSVPSGSMLRAGKTRESRKAVIAASAAFMVIAVVALFWFLRQPASPEDVVAERSIIAVMPFSIQGDTELQYLETGMVDLLTRKLDGAGTLRGVDPNALLGRLGEDVRGIRDPAEARELAAGFGAGQFIVGSVTKIGDQIQMNASLYEADGSLTSEAQVSTTGASELMASIDALAQQLIAEQLSDPSQQLDRTAALTTESLPALKAFLEGERAIAEGRFNDGVEALQQAVELDTTFALAWYRLRDGIGWSGGTLDPRRTEALEKAFEYSDRLPPDVVRMLEAERATDEARFEDARSIYQSLVRQEPDNVGAWLKLGDLVYHYGDRSGYPAVLAREPFQRALALNPGNREGQVHLIDIAAKERDSTGLAALIESYGPELREHPVFVMEQRIASGEELAGPLLSDFEELTRENPAVGFRGIMASASIREDARGAQVLADKMASMFPDDENMQGPSKWMKLVQGKVDSAVVEMVDEDVLGEEPAEAAFYESILAVLPVRPLSDDQIQDALKRIQSFNGEGVLPPPLAGQEPALRPYGAGLLHYAIGDMAGVERSISDLEQIQYDGEAPDLSIHLAEALRALKAWKDGDRQRALSHLDGAHVRLHWAYSQTPVLDESFLRWARAEILRDMGRNEEALRYYDTLAGIRQIWGLAYLGPSYLRRGEIHETLGNDAEAIDYYSRLIDLWKDADEKLQPSVDEAHSAIQRILDRQAREEG